MQLSTTRLSPLLRLARPDDRAPVLALLREAGLPDAGLEDAWDHLVVAVEEGRVVGAAGLEVHGAYGLLRSVVVAPERRGTGLGGRLTEAVLDVARRERLSAVYLLTTTAERFFPRLGFETVARADVPAELGASRELQDACPATAVVQRRVLAAGSEPDGALRSDAVALHRALTDLIRVYQFRDRDRICCHGLSVSQCYALEAVLLGGGLTLNDLAAELFLDKSTMSRIARGLEEKGLVSRRPHPDDGRAVLFEATEEGRRLHARIEGEILAEEEVLLAGFAPEVRRELPKVVGALARAAACRVDTSGGSCCRIC